MPRPIHAVIHQQALQHNLQVARSRAPQSRVFAVVKADAYGHGIERVYPALKSADGFAFLDLTEGKRLRALGCDKPLLLLEGISSALPQSALPLEGSSVVPSCPTHLLLVPSCPTHLLL